ncbi:hypothetical protein [Changchengzhania lutea]|uniref:hypothetical protein n=1 Tax=Changchengzhania lutea TaxID=2049305 RepID=UPI00115F2797|nr:hypothetical protein [Changchengzhania lutea]
MNKQTGWKPIPLALKILFVVFILWSIGAVLNLPNLFESGLPLFGIFVHGIVASLIVLFLDIIGPIIFLFGLWNRKPWAPVWAFFYIGFFILNNTVAFFTVREQLGLVQILIPIVASVIFIIVIYTKRSYFK